MGHRALTLLLVLLIGCRGEGAVTTSTPRLTTREPPTQLFDVGQFTRGLFMTLFSEDERIALIVLVPLEEQSLLESPTLDLLSDLVGYEFAGPEQVEEAAQLFAQAHDSQPLKGSWVAYGLIPTFGDTAIDEWERVIGGISGAVTAERRVPELDVELPDGWTVVSELPFGVSGGSVVAFSARGVVVIDRKVTRFIGLDGSASVTPVQPLPVTESCCGSTEVFAVGNTIVGLEGAVDAWVLNVETMSWREVDPRPSSANPLGVAGTNASIAMLTAAARQAAGVSTVAILDLASGAWAELEPVPEPITVGGITADGRRLFVAGTHQGGSNNILGDSEPVVYEFNEATGWTALPDIPIHGQASTVTWVEETGLLGWNYDLESALLDESGDWRDAGSVPMRPAECYPRSEALQGGALAICGGLAWFDDVNRDWHRILEPEGAVAWFGTSESGLVGLLRTTRDRTLLIAYELKVP